MKPMNYQNISVLPCQALNKDEVTEYEQNKNVTKQMENTRKWKLKNY